MAHADAASAGDDASTRSYQSAPRARDGETSPLVGVLFLGVTVGMLTALGALVTTGTTPSGPGAEAGVAVDVGDDPPLVVTYVMSTSADHVDVTVGLPDGRVHARLDRPGARLVVDREHVRIEGDGLLVDGSDDAIGAPEPDGRRAERPAPADGPVDVRAVAVTESGRRSVSLDRTYDR